MRRHFRALSYLALVAAMAPAIVASAADPIAHLARAVPADAYLFVYAKYNPERDFQRAYYADIWNTVEETQIVERCLEIITSRIGDEDLQEANRVFEDVRVALAPIDWQAVLNAQEFVYAQKMSQLTSQHLWLMRLTPEAAASCDEGLVNLFRLVEKYSSNEVPVEARELDGVRIATLDLPAQVPFRPSVTHLDDILIISTSEAWLHDCRTLVQGQQGDAKFDDPRLQAALSQLPDAEDALTFYDQRMQLEQLQELVSFLRAQIGNDEEAAWVPELIASALDEVMILDYEVTVEYTEGYQNRTMALGKLAAGAEGKVLTQVFGSGEPYSDWQTWIPAGATSYSLSTGANLHPLYEWGISQLRGKHPELDAKMDALEAWQESNDFHFDRDILQSFSGECVCVTFPGNENAGGAQSVTALRCTRPDRIRALLHRLVDMASGIPFLQAQQLSLQESELEGFEELSFGMLNAFGARPAIGFRDGWMLIGSNTPAVQTFLETRAGDRDNISQDESFQQFHFDVSGPVHAISYANLAQSTRQSAAMLRQAGAFVPMVIGLVGAQADPDAMQVIQEVVGLLPDVATIVEKFDFLEAKLSVTQDGPQPGTYLRRNVVVVRPPGEN